MLKPKKRKNTAVIMRGKDGGLVGYNRNGRIVITQEAIDGVHLVYSTNYRYPQAMKFVREVLRLTENRSAAGAFNHVEA